MQPNPIAVTSNDLPISKVDDYVENYLARQISRITGVGLIDFHGEQKDGIRAEVTNSVSAANGKYKTVVADATMTSPKFDDAKVSVTVPGD